VINRFNENLDLMRRRVEGVRPVDKIGQVRQVTGPVIESDGPEVSLGEVCEIVSTRKNVSATAEVVGFRDNRVLLMPLGDLHDIHPGCQVIAATREATIPVGEGLVGRVIDGLGRPIDGKGPLRAHLVAGSLNRAAPNPMFRQRISEGFSTGVRSIDSFTPLGTGQRVGIFATSTYSPSWASAAASCANLWRMTWARRACAAASWSCPQATSRRPCACARLCWLRPSPSTSATTGARSC
jgi:flagellar biosynthesis/type III secretory pathway ATPase